MENVYKSNWVVFKNCKFSTIVSPMSCLMRAASRIEIATLNKLVTQRQMNFGFVYVFSCFVLLDSALFFTCEGQIPFATICWICYCASFCFSPFLPVTSWKQKFTCFDVPNERDAFEFYVYLSCVTETWGLVAGDADSLDEFVLPTFRNNVWLMLRNVRNHSPNEAELYPRWSESLNITTVLSDRV